VWCPEALVTALAGDAGRAFGLEFTIHPLPEAPSFHSPVLAVPPEALAAVAGVLVTVGAAAADGLPAGLLAQAIYEGVVRPLASRLRGRSHPTDASSAQSTSAATFPTPSPTIVQLTLTVATPQKATRMDATLAPDTTVADVARLVRTVIEAADGFEGRTDLREAHGGRRSKDQRSDR
jgi:hypothetical protein